MNALTGTRVEAVGAQIAALDDMKLAELRLRWAELAKAADKPYARKALSDLPTSPPKVSAGLLRLALAYHLQSAAFGGLPMAIARRLMLSTSVVRANGTKATPKPLCGTRLVRVWQDRTHVVTIGDHGAIRWNERDWPSLSAVAKAITGSHWSGPKFFGLRDVPSPAQGIRASKAELNARIARGQSTEHVAATPEAA